MTTILNFWHYLQHSDWGYWFLAYLLGSILSAVVVARCFGLPDPRQAGSHNPGATNMLRLQKRKWPAVLTFLGDFTKGWLVGYVGHVYGYSDTVIAVAVFAVFLGHIYPIFFKLRGGKGVATAAGIFWSLSCPVGGLITGSWLCALWLLRSAGMAAVVASLVLAVVAYWWPVPVYQYVSWGIAALLLWRHRQNMQQYWRR